MFFLPLKRQSSAARFQVLSQCVEGKTFYLFSIDREILFFYLLQLDQFIAAVNKSRVMYPIHYVFNTSFFIFQFRLRQFFLKCLCFFGHFLFQASYLFPGNLFLMDGYRVEEPVLRQNKWNWLEQINYLISIKTCQSSFFFSLYGSYCLE
jgi:hypothetical protein